MRGQSLLATGLQSAQIAKFTFTLLPKYHQIGNFFSYVADVTEDALFFWILNLIYIIKFTYNTIVAYNPNITLTIVWLAQLIERRSTVRKVEGSSPRPDQHSGS